MTVKKLWKNFNGAVIWVMMTVLLVGTIGIHSFADNSENKVEAEGVSVPEVQPEPGMQLVAEDAGIALYVDMSTSDFYVLDKKTQKKYTSTPQGAETDSVANDEVKTNLRSILSVVYYNNKNAVASMNTFSESLPYHQVKVTRIEGGVRSVFTIGQQDTRRVIPQAMRKSEFEKLIGKLPDSDQTRIKTSYKLYTLEMVSGQSSSEDILEKYPGLEQNDLYILRPGQGERKLAQLEESFSSLGLTVDDIDKENTLLGVNLESEEKPVFVIPVTFRIDHGAFVAEIESKDIQVPGNCKLHRINFLEYFGATPSSERGYFVVPDGSGAIIEFNNNKYVKSYTQNVYGSDHAIKEKEKVFYGQNAVMPVFGCQYQQGGMFAVIESGEALAAVNANISGLISQYNNIFASFTVSPSSFMSYNKAMKEEGVYLFPKEISRTPIRIRYAFLDKEHYGYVGMAKYYRKYLEDRGMLKKVGQGDTQVPFYVEMQGAIEKKKMIFGIAQENMYPLTTFKQAREIYDSIVGKGISNINVRYAGWCNKGFYNTLNNRMSIQKELGSKGELAKLQQYLKQKGSNIYMDVDFMYVGKDTWFDGFSPSGDASIFLDRKLATVFPYDPASYFMKNEKSYGKYVLSPKNYIESINGFLQDYRQLGFDAISAGTMGGRLNSDYNSKNMIDRNTAQSKVMDGLKKLAESSNHTMVNYGNAYVLPYVSDILEIPLCSSNLVVESESIPFYPIVLHGYVRYAGEAMNTSLDSRKLMLKSVETGAGLYYKWMYEEDDAFHNTKYMYSMYSFNYSNWLDHASNVYGKMNVALQGTQNSTIDDHVRIQDNVYKTVFSNHIEVVVNYNRYPVEVEGVAVNAEDFAVVGGR